MHRWINETGAKDDPFDVIIDDGGHSNMQQYNSFMVLFEHALRPGGIYVLEDIHCSRNFVDGDKEHVMIEVIKDWIEILVMGPSQVPAVEGKSYTPKFKLPPRIRSIDCWTEACVFTKCFKSDARCSEPSDASLESYSDKGTAMLSAG